MGNQVEGINTFTSIIFDSPIDSDRVITSIVTPKPEEVSKDLSAGLVRPILKVVDRFLADVPLVETTADKSELVSIVSGRIEDIISNSIIQSARQITSIISYELDNTALSNINFFEVAAYLDVDFDATDTTLYVADTSKFKSNGYLLIGNEIVRYYKKISDRFLSVQRGQNNTTAQFWPSGTFLRQIPDPVSVAFSGVSAVESQSLVVTMPAASSIGGVERKVQNQILENISIVNTSRVFETHLQASIQVDSVSDIKFFRSPYVETSAADVLSFVTTHNGTSVKAEVQSVISEVSSHRNSTEILIMPPPSGVVDGFVESVALTDPIETRLNGFVDIDNSYRVVQRDGTEIAVVNAAGGTSGYVGTYSVTNVGPTLGNFNQILDDGVCDVSALNLIQLEFYYPTLTLDDLVSRAKSSYTKTGAYFNLANPSSQNPVTIVTANISIEPGFVINVQNTDLFPESGYLFTSSRSLIRYISKTATSFNGCTLVRGSSSFMSIGEEIIPYSID